MLAATNYVKPELNVTIGEITAGPYSSMAKDGFGNVYAWGEDVDGTLIETPVIVFHQSAIPD